MGEIRKEGLNGERCIVPRQALSDATAWGALQNDLCCLPASNTPPIARYLANGYVFNNLLDKVYVMNASAHPEVTHLLHQWQEGDEAALDRLVPLVYDELHRQAHQHMRRERDGHTLSTTALVHEAFLNLAGESNIPWQSRAHFFAIASRVMRRVLIWYARKRNADKRGGGQITVALDSESDFDGAALLLTDSRIEELLAIDQALGRLEIMDERLCRVVECRHFGGMSVKETGEALGISPATVKRDWQTARAWLRRELSE